MDGLITFACVLGGFGWLGLCAYAIDKAANHFNPIAAFSVGLGLAAGIPSAIIMQFAA